MKTRNKIHLATTPVDSPLRVAYRFAIGQDLNGGYKTDHKWSKAGTQITSANGRATRWAHQPMRRRAGLRFLGLFAVLALLTGLVVSPSGTEQTLRVLAWLALLSGGWVVYERARKFSHRRNILAPLAEALAQRLSDSRYLHDPRAWIQVPVDVQDGTTIIYLPTDYDPSETQEKALVRMVGSKVGLRNPTPKFVMTGERPYLELRPAPAPRDVVRFDDPEIAAMVAASPDGDPLLGLGPRDAPYRLDLDTESPHVGFSMATGAGKSVAARALVMQVLHHGGIALILDRKQVSQAWCRGLPSVHYASSPREIHEALLWLSTEIDRRFEVIRVHADIRGHVDPELVGPRLLVVGEELNTLEQDVSTYWRSIRQQGEPMKPTSLAALGRAMAMGRAGRVNVIPIGQKLTAQAIGGTAARENMSTRVLGRATVSTWNMLAPECKVGGRYPKSSRIRGRVHVAADGEATPVQVLYADEQEAIDHASSGVLGVFPVGRQVGGAQPADHRETSEGTYLPDAFMPAEDDDLNEPDALLEELDLATLSSAAGRLGLNLKTLRNARETNQHFPEPVETAVGTASLYHYPDLEKWAIDRGSGPGGDAR